MWTVAKLVELIVENHADIDFLSAKMIVDGIIPLVDKSNSFSSEEALYRLLCESYGLLEVIKKARTDRNFLPIFKKYRGKHHLTSEEIEFLLGEILNIEACKDRFRFNEGVGTGFNEYFSVIRVNKCILTGQDSVSPYYKLTPKGILAHEYWGHLHNHPSPFGHNTPEDECWADDSAARYSPGLSDEERTVLFRRALRHAQIARDIGVGITGFKYNIDGVIRRYINDDEIRKFI